MSHRVIVRIEAERDITDAAVWYHQQQRGLGHEFLSVVEAAIGAAADKSIPIPVPSPQT
jgi:hypothetical protein